MKWVHDYFEQLITEKNNSLGFNKGVKVEQELQFDV
jgi:hypothetical protein